MYPDKLVHVDNEIRNGYFALTCCQKTSRSSGHNRLQRLAAKEVKTLVGETLTNIAKLHFENESEKIYLRVIRYNESQSHQVGSNGERVLT